jgi:hypothetical protein
MLILGGLMEGLLKSRVLLEGQAVQLEEPVVLSKRD